MSLNSCTLKYDEKRLRLKQQLFEAFLVIFVIVYMVTRSTVEDLIECREIFKLLYWISGVGALCSNFITPNYSVKHIAKFIVCLVIAWLAFYLSEDIITVLTGIFIISASNIDVEKIVKDMFFPILLMFVIIVALSLTGVTENLLFEMPGRYRYSIGFYHPNNAGLYSMVLVLLWIARRFDKLDWRDYLGILAFAMIIYKITDSRSGELACIAALLITAVVRLSFKRNLAPKLIKTLSLYVVPIMVALSVLLSYKYQDMGALGAKLDAMFTGRLALQNVAVTEFGISLFGQLMDFHWSDSYYYIDSSYIRCLVYAGLAFFLLVTSGYEYAIHRAFTERRGGILIGLLVYSIYGFIQGSMYNAATNVFLVYIGQLCFTDRDKSSISYESLPGEIAEVDSE